MLSVSPATRVFVATAPVDLRGSFNALHARVQTQLAQDPLSGHLFVFTNTRRNRVKILCWDGSGLWVCAKRLEKGRFPWPSAEPPVATLRSEELLLLLAGLEVRPKRGWYRR
jgi:transposase